MSLFVTRKYPSFRLLLRQWVKRKRLSQKYDNITHSAGALQLEKDLGIANAHETLM
jgi:hypothetical protein